MINKKNRQQFSNRERNGKPSSADQMPKVSISQFDRSHGRDGGRQDNKDYPNGNRQDHNRSDSYKQRGGNNRNYQALIDKYNLMAKEALNQDDMVTAESYLQHADHYLRLLNQKNENQENNHPARRHNNQRSQQKEDQIADQGSSQGEERYPPQAQINETAEPKKEHRRRIVKNNDSPVRYPQKVADSDMPNNVIETERTEEALPPPSLQPEIIVTKRPRRQTIKIKAN